MMKQHSPRSTRLHHLPFKPLPSPSPFTNSLFHFKLKKNSLTSRIFHFVLEQFHIRISSVKQSIIRSIASETHILFSLLTVAAILLSSSSIQTSLSISPSISASSSPSSSSSSPPSWTAAWSSCCVRSYSAAISVASQKRKSDTLLANRYSNESQEHLDSQTKNQPIITTQNRTHRSWRAAPSTWACGPRCPPRPCPARRPWT